LVWFPDCSLTGREGRVSKRIPMEGTGNYSTLPQICSYIPAVGVYEEKKAILANQISSSINGEEILSICQHSVT